MLSTTDFEKPLSINMDKITIIKMLLASQDENRQLQARLDKQDEEARLREDRLNSRIDELTRLNRVSSESQIRLMDQLAELQRQLKQMSGQYGKMLTGLKKRKDQNKKIIRKS
jgi:thiamine biosynthesis lipoprotein ApbE